MTPFCFYLLGLYVIAINALSVCKMYQWIHSALALCFERLLCLFFFFFFFLQPPKKKGYFVSRAFAAHSSVVRAGEVGGDEALVQRTTEKEHDCPEWAGDFRKLKFLSKGLRKWE